MSGVLIFCDDRSSSNSPARIGECGRRAAARFDDVAADDGILGPSRRL